MPQTHAHANRPNTGTFGTGRGSSATVRVHGSQRPTHLRGFPRREWMVR